ncbi:hypothetical protein DPEC_G00206110 [Dallia pectoralis]|uniref:Uncharacterized protein n=1 Tax=Dallia pectoralis TaxID=75939 RepID=A0ACC2G4H6_DALPE|nr:hypothetical protein DPEC_G00206110 [Dallia pectoralis]
MPKIRRGCGGTRRDLWTLAGGEDRVLQSFINVSMLPYPKPSNSEEIKNDVRESETGTESEQVKVIEDDRNDDIANQGTESEDFAVDGPENNEILTCIGTDSKEEEVFYSEMEQGETGTDSEDDGEDDSKIETQTGTESEERDSAVEQVERKVKQRDMKSEKYEESEFEQEKDYGQKAKKPSQEDTTSAKYI